MNDAGRTSTEAGASDLSGKMTAFDAALAELAEAAPFAKARYQTPVFRLGGDLLESEAGVAALAERARGFDAAGVFHGGPWEDPGRLVPDLVGFGLKGEGPSSIVEALSELRMLAIARGEAESPGVDADAARQFLRAACAKNLDLVFPEASEETRLRPGIFARAERLFALIMEQVSIDGLRARVVEEIELICAQRPIMTARVRRLVARAARLPGGADDTDVDRRLEDLRRAVDGPSPLSRDAGPVAYRQLLQAASPQALADESHAFRDAMAATGLCSPQHAVLLRRLLRDGAAALEPALDLDGGGKAELEQHAELVVQLVKVAVRPATAGAIYGLARLLDRGLLSRSEVEGGLRRLMDLDIRPEVQETLLEVYPHEAALSPQSILTAGALCVLGQPLGVGQGRNPTCQAARGLSLWSLHAPGLLLGMLANAARDGLVQVAFEGQMLRSDLLLAPWPGGEADPELDPVSRVLVPHLDRLYGEMLRRCTLRPDDPHKWVNPAMYGRWVTSGFLSALNPAGTTIQGHERFVRRFFATHHPDFNDGHALIYPNPVGLMVTDVHGSMLGPHAVSIQRIADDPGGELRVYFFNPNNEGRQDWGQGVRPAVRGHGEIPGESSLPFEDFLSRLYAFHFDIHEEGDAFAVPPERVKAVSRATRESWGRAFTWID